jgi:hypothetical protein
VKCRGKRVLALSGVSSTRISGRWLLNGDISHSIGHYKKTIDFNDRRIWSQDSDIGDEEIPD